MLVILPFGGCNRSPKPEQLYTDARKQLERGDLLAALSLAEKGLSTSQREITWEWRFRELKAEILIWQGNSSGALALLSEREFPASLGNDEVAVRLKITQGMASYYLQHFDDAERYLAKAEELANSNHPGLKGEVLVAQGALAILRADPQTAERRLSEGVAAAHANGRGFVEANALGSLGVIAMRRQHYDEAIDRFAASLTISEKIPNQVQVSKTSGNLGWCYFKMGDRERAFEAFSRSEELAGKLGLARDQQVWLTNIGLVYNDEGEFGKATEYYSKALEIAKKQQNKTAIAESLTNLAATALNEGQYDQAEKYNREALELKRSIGDKGAELYSLVNEARIAEGRKQLADAAKLLHEVVARSGEDVSLKWEAESELANVYAIQGDNAAAESQFRRALTTVDSARASLKQEEHRLSFLGSAERFYNDYIDFLIWRGRTKEALGVAEHSRARTLAEGLKIPIAGVMEAGFSPEQTARKLNSVILSYWLKPKQSYLWAVTASRVELFKLPPAAEIEGEAQAYRKALMGPRDVRESANADGAKLYETLVAPAQKLISTGARVVVIGGGALNTLNFETLLVAKPQLHYWIEDAVVSNASSIALLSGEGRSKGASGKSLLLIGNPVYAGSEFPELKQAKLELTDVAQHFAANERQILEGAAASPAAYASTDPGRFSYVHFVAHGTASRTSPLESSIILSRQSDAYKLYARDIMKTPLRAELVTISACYGAGTRSYSGEGLVGLSWAFLRAGAHNVIAALWEVSDSSTPELMDNLYGRLKEGQDPAAALREAKLKMLRSDSVYRRPFYWGAFQLYSGWTGRAGTEKNLRASVNH